MFCFCLHSSPFKLQAEGERPGDGAAEERKSPEPHDRTDSPVTPQPGGGASPQPGGGASPQPGGGASPQAGGGALLQLLGGGASPLPSPRCPALSLRFQSDPEAAPSPPSSQQDVRSRVQVQVQVQMPADRSPQTVSSLRRHIQTLKRRVHTFEENFEHHRHYKPSHNDKQSHPEMFQVMEELSGARRRLKELRLRQSLFESTESNHPKTPEVCRSSSIQQETLEDTVETLLQRLREKRQETGVPENTEDMTPAQMVLEKISLQKCLLYLENVHGRPGNKKQKSLVKPLYDRYQTIKRSLCVSPPITTIEEEEEGSDEEQSSAPPPPAAGEDDGDPASVSPLDEAEAVRQPIAVTTANLHGASRAQLLRCLRETRAETRTRRKLLRDFEKQFLLRTGRVCQKEDRGSMKVHFHEYKQLKAKLRLLEALLSKEDI